MKKLILILALCTLLSCEKDLVEPTFCWSCITVKHTLDHKAFTDTVEYCGYTVYEIEVIEDNLTYRYSDNGAARTHCTVQ